MSAVENLLNRKGPATVDKATIIQEDGSEATVDARRARSLVSRGLATYAAGDTEATSEPEQPAAEPIAQADPASEPQAEDSPTDDEHAKYVRTLEDMTREEVSELAKAEGLPYSGTKATIIERLSAAYTSGANAEDEPLSGSDSNAD